MKNYKFKTHLSGSRVCFWKNKNPWKKTTKRKEINRKQVQGNCMCQNYFSFTVKYSKLDLCSLLSWGFCCACSQSYWLQQDWMQLCGSTSNSLINILITLGTCTKYLQYCKLENSIKQPKSHRRRRGETEDIANVLRAPNSRALKVFLNSYFLSFR